MLWEVPRTILDGMANLIKVFCVIVKTLDEVIAKNFHFASHFLKIHNRFEVQSIFKIFANMAFIGGAGGFNIYSRIVTILKILLEGQFICME